MCDSKERRIKTTPRSLLVAAGIAIPLISRPQSDDPKHAEAFAKRVAELFEPKGR